MTKILTMIIFTAVVIFFGWQVLIAIDKTIEINHDRDCKEALQAENWVYLNNFCKE